MRFATLSETPEADGHLNSRRGTSGRRWRLVHLEVHEENQMATKPRSPRRKPSHSHEAHKENHLYSRSSSWTSCLRGEGCGEGSQCQKSTVTLNLTERG